jgi:hypothetical protein
MNVAEAGSISARRSTLASRLSCWPDSLVAAAVFAFGLAVRLIAAGRLSFHVDEQFSLLGAHAVAERGIPLLPSGVPYLHGATLSYLLAPLVRLGLGDLSQLETLRLVSVVAGALAVVLAYGLARDVLGVRWAALLAAVPIALDPLSVQFSAHVRMYALLQALVLALLWVFLRIVRDGPTRWSLVALVVTFWAAIFTHLEAGLLLLPMVLVVLALRHRFLPPQRLALSAALAGCALAPLALVATTRIIAATASQRPTSLPDTAFLGEQMVNVQGVLVLQPDLTNWRALFAHHAFADVMPVLLAVLSGVLIARCVLPGDVGAEAVPRAV